MTSQIKSLELDLAYAELLRGRILCGLVLHQFLFTYHIRNEMRKEEIAVVVGRKFQAEETGWFE